MSKTSTPPGDTKATPARRRSKAGHITLKAGLETTFLEEETATLSFFRERQKSSSRYRVISQSRKIPITITSARERCARSGENSARETAAIVVNIATNNILRTFSTSCDERQYQKAPSTATPIMIGTAIPSITENVQPNIDITPISAPTTSAALPNVTTAITGSRRPIQSAETRSIAKGNMTPFSSLSANVFDLANSILTPTASKVKLVDSDN